MVRLGALLVVLATACASAGATVAEYTVEMETITVAYVGESQNLSADYQASVEDGVRDLVAAGGADVDEQAVRLVASSTIAYLALLADSMGRFASSMEDVEPPPALADDHDEFVHAVRSVYSSLPATRDAVAEADSIDAIALALTSSGFADGQARWTAACTALEQSVRDTGSGIDLGCVRPQVVP